MATGTLWTATALAGALDDSPNLTAQAMDLQYRMHRSAGNGPLSPQMQALEQTIGQQTAQGLQNNFQRSISDTAVVMKQKSEANNQPLRAKLAQMKADLAAKDPSHKARGGSAPPVSSKTVAPPPSSRARNAPVVLDGSKVEREVEFGGPKKSDSPDAGQ
jgi:hypothetical protein